MSELISLVERTARLYYMRVRSSARPVCTVYTHACACDYVCVMLCVWCVRFLVPRVWTLYRVYTWLWAAVVSSVRRPRNVHRSERISLSPERNFSLIQRVPGPKLTAPFVDSNMGMMLILPQDVSEPPFDFNNSVINLKFLYI